MATIPDSVFQSLDNGNSPLELLMVGCSPEEAARCVTALRNSGQAARMESADSRDTLVRLLETEPADIVTVNMDSNKLPADVAIELVREANPSAAIILTSSNPQDHIDFAIQNDVRDLVNSSEHQYFVFSLKREYQTLLLRQELATTKRRYESARKRFLGLLTHAQDAIAYIHDGMHVQANPAYCEMFGITEEDIEGLPAMDLITPESRDAFKKALRKSIKTGSLSKTLVCRRMDGSNVEVDMELSSSELGGEICTQIIIHQRDQSDELQARITELSNTDPLTGLSNRYAFIREFESALAQGKIEPGTKLVEIAIHNFSEIYDSTDVFRSDQLLKGSADLIRRELSPHARLLARFGDHEFMALLHSEQQPADQVIDACLRTLETGELDQHCDLPIAPRFGAGRISVDGQQSARELIRQCCKINRKTHQPTEEQSQEPPQEDVIAPTSALQIDRGIIDQIDYALEHDTFRLMYQPIVSLGGDTRENYSVLLRLVTRSGEEKTHEWFEEAARQGERLAEIDRWVIRQAIRELARHRQTKRKINFHIQLSREGAMDDSMLLWVCDCLREFRAKGAWLYFQFDMEQLRKATPEVIRLIEGLKKINCRISCGGVDDRNLDLDTMEKHQVDIVRLAPSMVENLAADAKAQDRLAALNTQIQEAGIKTIATSIENANTLALLWNIGVNLVQGYFLQEPAPSIDTSED